MQIKEIFRLFGVQFLANNGTIVCVQTYSSIKGKNTKLYILRSNVVVMLNMVDDYRRCV